MQPFPVPAMTFRAPSVVVQGSTSASPLQTRNSPAGASRSCSSDNANTENVSGGYGGRSLARCGDSGDRNTGSSPVVVSRSRSGGNVSAVDVGENYRGRSLARCGDSDFSNHANGDGRNTRSEGQQNLARSRPVCATQYQDSCYSDVDEQKRRHTRRSQNLHSDQLHVSFEDDRPQRVPEPAMDVPATNLSATINDAVVSAMKQFMCQQQPSSNTAQDAGSKRESVTAQPADPSSDSHGRSSHRNQSGDDRRPGTSSTDRHQSKSNRDAGQQHKNNDRDSRRRQSQSNGGGGGGDPSSSDDSSDGESSGDGGNSGRGRQSRDRSPGSSRGSSARTRYVMSHNRMKPDKFDGTQCWQTFLVKFENCADYNKWTEHDKRAYLRASLQKEAAKLLWDADDLTYDQLVQKLRQRFGSKGMEEQYQTELRCRRRKKGEFIRELAQDIRRLLSLAYPGEQSKMFEVCAKDAFLAALNDPEAEMKIREREPETLDAAVKIAQRLEITRSVVYASHTPTRDRVLRQVVEEETAASPTREVLDYEPPARPQSASMNEHPGTRRSDSRQPGSGRPRNNRAVGERKQSRAVDCGVAKPPPHTDSRVTEDIRSELSELRKDFNSLVKQLSEAQNRQQTAPPTPQPAGYTSSDGYYVAYGRGQGQHYTPALRGQYNDAAGSVGCFNCGQPGHYARACPNRQQQPPPSNNPDSARISSARSGSATNPSNATYLRAKINGIWCSVLLDSGSEVSVVPRHLVENCQLEPTTQTLKAANGSPIPVLGEVTVLFSTPKFKSEVTALVTDHVAEPMLGANWLCANKVD